MDKNQDLYAVLGVSKTAGQEEIRAAYRRLAKQSHPDLHPGDKVAEDTFKLISAANDILGDEEKRKRYDRGEIDASGAETHPGGAYRQYADGGGRHQYHSSSGYEDFADISDIFSDLFGHSAGSARTRGAGGTVSMRGRDVSYTLGIDFLDAVQGAKHRVTLPDGKSLDVSIPPGVKDGQLLRLKGKGEAGLGEGKPGDALIAIAIRPHTLFKRSGNDILIEVPVSLPEAILGGRIQVPTISGPVTMTVPKGTNNGAVLRLKNKGVKSKSTTGDQLVTIKVMLPDRIDDDLASFVTEWQASHAYNPRSSGKEYA